jgi:hypothetical protein
MAPTFMHMIDKDNATSAGNLWQALQEAQLNSFPTCCST